MQGWISIHRQLKEHWLWKDKPFSKGQAWIDLIMSASHKDTKFPLGNELIEIERGSFITSEIKLMDKWGWSKTKVRSFLKLLEDDEMIVKKSDKKKTTINICNYNDYQILETTEEPQKNHKETTKRPQKNTINNVNNSNNENKKDNIPFQEIISYLNSKTNKQYKSSTKKNKELIIARWNDGFRLEDFKRVIDIKSSKWTGTDMEQYLRPLTLFGTKFESYLNESTNKPNQPKPERSTYGTDWANYKGDVTNKIPDYWD